MFFTNTIFKQIWIGALSLLFITAGCDVLKVNNPNSLVEEDLGNPAAAPAIANGAEATLTEALGNLLAPYSTATDELTWIGTRDAWQDLDQGELENPLNEFSDGAFNAISESRWTADNAISRLEGFREEGTLEQAQPLVRSYLYGAVNYLAIAASFNNVVIGDRQEAVPPVGEENMATLYDTAISYLDQGLELSSSGSEWEVRLLAVRARAYFEQALWNKLNPDVATGDPLVQSTEAVNDAKAALALAENGTDWNYQLEVTSETPSNNMAFQVNERLELRIGNTFVTPTEDNTKAESVSLEDPIDEVPAPYLVNRINTFVEANEYADITIASVRELHLIIAEDALARDDEEAFQTAINNLRSLDGLSAYENQLPAVDLLKHERQVNLFLQGRRLADLYRFEESSTEWLLSRVEAGNFFPITITEIRANPNITLD
ncbi:hypothetical protein [Fodinibius salsisoli]|uniref:SusD family protein n=1 Tax=Fodinibius salsisoli TaxID=2820877 RepID=A0ABT3PI39_9BACT|nr:hypothetical protein [Fodinibius salsisoli]MCW9705581.1 hypothetical protein [Fodinibius salsisoli]